MTREAAQAESKHTWLSWTERQKASPAIHSGQRMSTRGKADLTVTKMTVS